MKGYEFWRRRNGDLFLKYIVKTIQEADFGCEERPAGYKPLVIVRLCDESGHETDKEVPDADLYAEGIGEGDTVYFDTDENIRKVFCTFGGRTDHCR